MKKNKITKLKDAIFTSLCDNCTTKDTEVLIEKINAIIDDHFDPKPVEDKKSKPYLASTGESAKIDLIVRTKGQSQRADDTRGKGV